MGNLEKAGVLVVVVLLGVIMAVAFLTDPDEGSENEGASNTRVSETDSGTPPGLRESRDVDENPPVDPDPNPPLNRSEESGIVDVTDQEGAGPGSETGGGNPEAEGRGALADHEAAMRARAEAESRELAGAEPVDPKPAPASGRTVTVEQNDKLWLIAKRAYGAGHADRMVPLIAKLNGITDPRRLRAGMILQLPELEEAPAIARSGAGDGRDRNQGERTAGKREAGKERVTAARDAGSSLPFDPGAQPWEDVPAGAGTAAAGGGRTVIVRRNETLSEISLRELGSVKFVKDIMELNGIKDARKVRAGQSLRLPARTAARR